MASETQDQAAQKNRGWYSVSVASVQKIFTFVGLVVLIAIAFVAYRQWEIYTLEGRAQKVIDEADALIAQIKMREDAPELEEDHAAAWQMLAEAKRFRDEGNHARALEQGEHCLMILRNINDSGRGSIRVLSVQGNVEYRRGERGAWRRLRSNETLNPGDWVKTSTDGTAELLFADRSTFNLRQSTMVHLGASEDGREDRSTDTVAFGRVELNTSDRERKVSTPQSEAKVRGTTEALVAFDRDRGRGRFAAFSGQGLEVASKSGQVRQIGALQQVEMIGDRLTEVKALPNKPVLTSPTDDRAIDLSSNNEVSLAWQRVPGARRYHLMISNTRLFAYNFIEDQQRQKTSARVGLRGEGSFFWRVAAVDSNGATGPWSDTRSFSVASLSSVGEVNDRTPPALEILGTETYGTLVIVNGRSEMGSTVTIAGEDVELKSDGSFSKTIQMTRPGWETVEIVATDAWNNVATERVRIFVDAI